MRGERSGLSVTAASDAAVDAWDALLDDYVAARASLPERLRDLLGADPEMPLAQVALGAFTLLAGKGEGVPRAQRAAAAACGLAAGATAREQLHARALQCWVDGDERSARGHWNLLLAEHPTDILALKLAQFSHFYAGESRAMLGSSLRAMDAWSPQTARYSYALGCHAFALEEAGQLDAAEACGREAVALQPEDPWAIHAVTHCLETRDRWDEGVQWIDDHREHFTGHATMDGHLRWHQALLLIDRGDAPAVLARFDTEFHAQDSEEYLDLCNDVALLQRLELCGLDVGARWATVADAVEPRLEDHMLLFCDAHYALALAAAGRSDAAREFVEAMTAQADESRGTAAAVVRTLGVPLCQGLIAWREQDHAAAFAALWSVRDDLHRMGGSHAQRDVFEQILIASATGCGQLAMARALLTERCRRAPGNALARQRLQALAGNRV